jgi:hypothetical protein
MVGDSLEERTMSDDTQRVVGIFILCGLLIVGFYLGGGPANLDDTGGIEGLILTAFLFTVYLLPVILATGRHHNDAAAIFALNLILGWTVIGWFLALLWSLTGSGPQARKI